jgi:hypothetical protein
MMTTARKSTSPARDTETETGEAHTVLIGLSAAVVSVANERPRVLVVHRTDEPDALPFGNFDPLSHRTLESGLRNWVGEQTRLQLGYVEQLYTFGDRGRHLTRPGEGPRVLSVGYLALTRPQEEREPETLWRDWYGYLPWEDWREEKPPIIDTLIMPRLAQFVAAAPNADSRVSRQDRVRLCFGSDAIAWDEEKVLERYELLYETGLVKEAQRDRQAAPAGNRERPVGGPPNSSASAAKSCVNALRPAFALAPAACVNPSLPLDGIILRCSISRRRIWNRLFLMPYICSVRA